MISAPDCCRQQINTQVSRLIPPAFVNIDLNLPLFRPGAGTGIAPNEAIQGERDGSRHDNGVSEMLDFGVETAAAFADGTLADVTAGLVAGTKVATPMGWRVIEAIAAGDKVLTFDGGMQTVVGVRRDIVWTGGAGSDPATWPLLVPAGALGNRAEMVLMPQQAVMVESDTAERLFGDPFATIPALALEGYRGIERIVPDARMEVVTLVFEQDEIVFGNIGALFLCPAQMDLLNPTTGTYQVMNLEDADMLVSFLELEDVGQIARPAAAQVFRAVA